MQFDLWRSDKLRHISLNLFYSFGMYGQRCSCRMHGDNAIPSNQDRNRLYYYCYDLQDRRLTSADSASILSKHMDLLADSITQFAVTNSALRCMLRDEHDHHLNTIRLSEQRDSLLSKLARLRDTCKVFSNRIIWLQNLARVVVL